MACIKSKSSKWRTAVWLDLLHSSCHQSTHFPPCHPTAIDLLEWSGLCQKAQQVALMRGLFACVVFTGCRPTALPVTRAVLVDLSSWDSLDLPYLGSLPQACGCHQPPQMCGKTDDWSPISPFDAMLLSFNYVIALPNWWFWKKDYGSHQKIS